MKKQLRTMAFMVGIGFMSICLAPVPLQAQQSNLDQQAYQSGYQHGVNDARQNRAMNMNNDDWHGDRLTAYQQGYQQGYNNAAGYQRQGGDADDQPYAQDPNATAPNGQYGTYSNGQYGQDVWMQRAYQAGYQAGIRDRQSNRAMNLNNDDWHGQRLQAYQQGYEQGYRATRGHHHHDDDDRR